MSDLEQVFQLIDGNKDIQYIGGNRSRLLIEEAEGKLNYKFPPTYSLFLRKYGFGGIGTLEVNGITDSCLDKPGEINVVWFALEERRTGMPENFIIISSTGFGPQYVLDSSQPDQYGEYPVLLWHCGDPLNTTEKVAEDFGEFLLEQVQQALVEDDD